MSKTSIKERNKAIRLAWEKEQKLVAEGKGTRDWSKDQQKDILDTDKGKAYDENGRAFEGQHMKSAAEFPEYQGDPYNIQFLKRDEHLEAHKGSWQNPTNWYYNPETKEFVDFGENKPIPCAVINLSEPVCSFVIDIRNKGDDFKETSKAEVESTESVKLSRREDARHHSETKSQIKTTVHPPVVHENLWYKPLYNAVKGLCKRHTILSAVKKYAGSVASVVVFVSAAFVVYANANSDNESGGGSKSSSSAGSSSYSYDDDYAVSLNSDDYNSSSSDRDYSDERSSLEEHTVPAHGQHYHTKNGVIWKEKEAYQRSGKHDDG